MEKKVVKVLDSGVEETRIYENGKLVDIRKKFPPNTIPRPCRQIPRTGGMGKD